jgi:small subunit ribosomal protein S7
MSRRRRAEKRDILPDPVYGSKLLAQFINLVMVDGKKSVSEKIVYEVLNKLEEKESDNSLSQFEKALESVGPSVEVKSRRVGGATYQVPIAVRPDRKLRLAMSWIIDAARKRHEKGFIAQLLGELKDILAGRGASLKKRDDTHKMAEANKAFAHYRW